MADTDVEVRLVDLTTQPVAVVRETVPMDAIRDYFDRVYGTVATVVSAQGAAPAGPALAIYRGVPSDTFDVAAGFPVDRPIESTDGVVADELPAGRAAIYTHRGSYDGLGAAYAEFMAWMSENGHTPGPLMWEVYVTEPTPDAYPADMLTELVWPLA